MMLTFLMIFQEQLYFPAKKERKKTINNPEIGDKFMFVLKHSPLILYVPNRHHCDLHYDRLSFLYRSHYDGYHHVHSQSVIH